jgi:hypothetical protein
MCGPAGGDQICLYAGMQWYEGGTEAVGSVKGDNLFRSPGTVQGVQSTLR